MGHAAARKHMASTEPPRAHPYTGSDHSGPMIGSTFDRSGPAESTRAKVVGIPDTDRFGRWVRPPPVSGFGSSLRRWAGSDLKTCRSSFITDVAERTEAAATQAEKDATWCDKAADRAIESRSDFAQLVPIGSAHV